MNIRGPLGLIIGFGLLAALLIGLPQARFLILASVPVGLLVAVILYFWHKKVPVKVEDKRPLKLDD